MSNSIDILDIIVKAAVQAKVDYVDRTQINKLYEIAWEFDVNKYPFKGINANEQLAYELILYMLRQSRRTKTIKTSRGSKNVSLISIQVAKYIIEGLKYIMSQSTNEDTLTFKNRILRFLGLFKWAYESLSIIGEENEMIVREKIWQILQRKNVVITNMNYNQFIELINELSKNDRLYR